MPTTTIHQLPIPASISLDDLVAIDQENNGVYITYQAPIRQLLGLATPEPTITNLTWTAVNNRLAIEGDNLLPTTLVYIDDIPYLFGTFIYGAIPNPNKSATIQLGISGLPSGAHTVKVKNLVHEVTDTFTS